MQAGVGLLDGKQYSKILESSRWDPKALARKLGSLFQVMATGGDFGADAIKHFNGGLFADADVVELTQGEIQVLLYANERDWSNVEPSVFGTLFERILDPAKRSQIGAHYTSKEDILTLLEPVMMAPLRREWEEVKAKSDDAYRRLIERFVAFYRERLFNPTWGEQVGFRRDNTLALNMVFQGIDVAAAGATWRPFFDWIATFANSAGSVTRP